MGKVLKPKENVVKDDSEIRITAIRSVSAYVTRAATVFNELEKPFITITATGNALSKAVTLAEVVKRRFKGLHQITTLGTTDIVDEYEPMEEGLDKVMDTRSVTFIEIKLSKEPLDTEDKGYQPPIDEALVTELDSEEMSKPRGRGRGAGLKGKGQGRTKDRKVSHDAADEASDDLDEPAKGKGKKGKKGKGKDVHDDVPVKGKGKKGKGKGKTKDFDDEEPSKGKGKKGKGKGKGKWDNEWEDGKGKKGKGKGKGKWEDDFEDTGKGKGKGKK